MNLALFAAVGIACVGGALAAAALGRRIIFALLRTRRFDTGQRVTVIKAAGAFGLVALLPAVLLGIVVGGTLGVAYGEAGVALGTFALVSILITVPMAAGAWIGRMLADRRDQ